MRREWVNRMGYTIKYYISPQTSNYMYWNTRKSTLSYRLVDENIYLYSNTKTILIIFSLQWLLYFRQLIFFAKAFNQWFLNPATCIVIERHYILYQDGISMGTQRAVLSFMDHLAIPEELLVIKLVEGVSQIIKQLSRTNCLAQY